ncbi:MAG: GGDEF domain-containing protein [bacterium]
MAQFGTGRSRPRNDRGYLEIRNEKKRGSGPKPLPRQIRQTLLQIIPPEVLIRRQHQPRAEDKALEEAVYNAAAIRRAMTEDVTSLPADVSGRIKEISTHLLGSEIAQVRARLKTSGEHIPEEGLHPTFLPHVAKRIAAIFGGSAAEIIDEFRVEGLVREDTVARARNIVANGDNRTQVPKQYQIYIERQGDHLKDGMRRREVRREYRKQQSLTRELEAEKNRLNELSYTDELTGLPNVRALTEDLLQLIKQGATEEALCIMAIDADYFKQINDNLGHDEGDNVLLRLAKSVSFVLRKGDKLYRVGGDEFIAVLPNTNPSLAWYVAERARLHVQADMWKMLEPLIRKERKEVRSVTVSIGIGALYPQEFRAVNNAIQQITKAGMPVNPKKLPMVKFADIAGYHVKEGMANFDVPVQNLAVDMRQQPRRKRIGRRLVDAQIMSMKHNLADIDPSLTVQINGALREHGDDGLRRGPRRILPGRRLQDFQVRLEWDQFLESLSTGDMIRSSNRGPRNAVSFVTLAERTEVMDAFTANPVLFMQKKDD